MKLFNDFVTFYSITYKAVNDVYQIFLYDEEGNSNNYGNEIFNSVWLYDGSFAFITDQYINIFDGKYKQLIQQIENPDNEIRILTPYTVASSIEGFIGCGLNKKMQFYIKKTAEEEPIETQNIITNNNENENDEKYNKKNIDIKIPKNKKYVKNNINSLRKSLMRTKEKAKLKKYKDDINQENTKLQGQIDNLSDLLKFYEEAEKQEEGDSEDKKRIKELEIKITNLEEKIKENEEKMKDF